MDDSGKTYNDVIVIKPGYQKNKDYLANVTCDYRPNFEKKLFIEV